MIIIYIILCTTNLAESFKLPEHNICNLAPGHLAQTKSRYVFRSPATSHLSHDQRHVVCLEVVPIGTKTPKARALKTRALLKVCLEGRSNDVLVRSDP